MATSTNREYKSIDALMAAITHLQAEGVKVDLLLIEGKSNAEALEAKATADIVYDQVRFGYGCSSVEAWGMGLPVIAGGEPSTLAMMRADWGDLPFYAATEKTIADAIRSLAKSRDLRAEWAEKGAAHAAKYHAEKPALARLAELYALAMKRQEIPKHYGPLAPRTYFDPKQRRIIVEGKRLEWSKDGTYTTTDADEQAELDRRVKAHRINGIKVVMEDVA